MSRAKLGWRVLPDEVMDTASVSLRFLTSPVNSSPGVKLVCLSETQRGKKTTHYSQYYDAAPT